MGGSGGERNPLLQAVGGGRPWFQRALSNHGRAAAVAAAALLVGVACVLRLATTGGGGVELASCCSGYDSSCCGVGARPWVHGAKLVDISPKYGEDVVAEAWYLTDVPAPEGADLGEDKAMKLSCKDWDFQVGDHIDKSCGEGIYEALADGVGDTASLFLSQHVAEVQLRALRKGSMFAPSKRDKMALKGLVLRELGDARERIVHCAREHAHVFLWTNVTDRAPPAAAAAAPAAKGGKEGGGLGGDGELEGGAIWKDPIPDVAAWSREKVARVSDQAALNRTEAEARAKEEAEKHRAVAEENARRDAMDRGEIKRDVEVHLPGEDDDQAEGLMAVTVGRGFDQCVAQYLAGSCRELGAASAMFADHVTGEAFSVSGPQACLEPSLLGEEGARGATRWCGVCCRLHGSLCARD